MAVDGPELSLSGIIDALAELEAILVFIFSDGRKLQPVLPVYGLKPERRCRFCELDR